jgi:hypothetical protein
VICPLDATSFDLCCRCPITLCPPGTVCKNHKCVPNIEVCLTDAKYEAKWCTDPRPNDKTCPNVMYIRAPDPAYCGVRADGSRVNFPREC